MNETYPNISVNSVRLSSDSSRPRKECRPKVQKVHGRESTCEQGLGLCFNSSESFQLGSVERACVRTVRNCHSPRGSPRVRGRYFRTVCGKKLSPRREKNRNATSDEFSRLESFSFISHTRGRDIGMKKRSVTFMRATSVRIFKFPFFCAFLMIQSVRIKPERSPERKTATYPPVSRFKLSRRIIRNLHLKTFVHFILNTRRAIYIYMDVQPTYYIRISVFTLFRYRITMRPTFISKSSLHLTRGGKKERKEENKKEKLTLVRIDLPLYSRSFKTHITRVSLIELSREKI